MNKIFGSSQVSRSHYLTKEYLNKSRFDGLYGQVNSCIKDDSATNILEIGPGPGLFSALMKQLGKNVTTIDFAYDLSPDLIARLPYIPLKSSSFDAVCAFEVLEHIPFNLLTDCLKEMGRVSHSLVIVSVPNVSRLNPKFEFSINLKLFNHSFKKSKLKTRNVKLFNPVEHYWEIGIDGIEPVSIVSEAKNVDLEIVETYFISPWFQFFIFKKAAS